MSTTGTKLDSSQMKRTYSTRGSTQPKKTTAGTRKALGDVTNSYGLSKTTEKPTKLAAKSVNKPLARRGANTTANSRKPPPPKSSIPRTTSRDGPPSCRTRRSTTSAVRMEVDEPIETPIDTSELQARFPGTDVKLLEAIAYNLSHMSGEPASFILHQGIEHLTRNAALFTECEGKLDVNQKDEIARLMCGMPIEEARHIADPDLAQMGELQMCADYVQDVFKFYKMREVSFTIKPYLNRTMQPHVGVPMRAVLIDWMIEVQENFELNHETLYQAVKLVDLYLARGPKVSREKLQLVGSAAMFIACKFDERIPPLLDDFVYICDYAYRKEEFIKMETKVLEVAQFDIGFPLSYRFLRRFSRLNADSMHALTLARFILEASLVEYQFCFELESKVAAGSLFLAHLMLARQAHEKDLSLAAESDKAELLDSKWDQTESIWSTLMTYHSGFSRAELVPLAKQLNELVKRATAGTDSFFKTVLHKYSHEVFYQVANTPSLQASQIS